MTDSEMFGFMDAFRSLQRVFPLRGDEHEIRDVGASYFRAMRRYPLSAVVAGAEAWIGKGERFPKPGQWIASIPPRTQATIQIARMTDAESKEHWEAEGLGYEGQPCLCSDCIRAGVDERPLRFVPEVDANGGDLKAEDVRGRLVTRGHWAHGDELFRWYDARGNFWNAMYERFGSFTKTEKRKLRQSFEQRMTEIFEEPKRTPPVVDA